MHILHKLIGLSVVFGLVLSVPTSQITAEFDDLSEDLVEVEDNYMDESRTVGSVLALPGLKLLPFVLKTLGLKSKAVAIGAAIIKWLAPKTIFLAIGAIATFVFCKLSSVCSVAYAPAVYDYVPSQMRTLVTPELLEDAQQFLISALQQYANSERI